MRTTIELPDQLLMEAKSRAALSGVSLREFFTEAIVEKLRPEPKKVRRPPPKLGGIAGPKIGILTAEQINEAMFG